ncbi:MAG: resA 7 [Schlesneria sp.]|nr:resA 7 [Schlesneria sp.]
MFLKPHVVFGLILTVCTLTGVGFAAEDKEEAKHPFSVKLVDEDGKPVEGATVGVFPYIGEKGSALTIDDGIGWHYMYGATSDADGIATLSDGAIGMDLACVVARHTGRQLTAVWKIDSGKLNSAKTAETIVLHLACRVSGKLVCRDLTDRNRPIGGTTAILSFGGGRALTCFSTDQTFQFFAPPGDYELQSHGANLHIVKTGVQIKPGQRELDLGSIEQPATRLALLIGEPAPEFSGVKCWKNSPGVNVADLKGKCVILDFWGYWCGPCVGQMPELFKLHAKYHDQGLEIIGVHVDLGEHEKEPVDTVEKLDHRLTDIRKDLWKGQDVPYPVALITGKRTSYGTAIETRKAASPIAALYGVIGYPTLILLDREGKVVGQFFPKRAEHIAQLEKLLKDQ